MTAKTYPGLLMLGGGYFVPVHEVTLIVPVEAVLSIDKDKTVDTTHRRKPRTAILTRSDRIILSHLAPDEVAERYERAKLALGQWEGEE